MNDLLWASSPSFFDLQFQLQQQPWQQQHPHHHRALQFVLPVYTSPPLPDAIEATPEEYRDDVVIDTMRALDAAGLCSAFNCHMAFLGDDDDDKKNNETVADVGILFYGGALVDPRSYSVWITTLASQGFPVVVPVFASDVAFGCGSGRLEMGKWISFSFLYVFLKIMWVLTNHIPMLVFAAICCCGTSSKQKKPIQM